MGNAPPYSINLRCGNPFSADGRELGTPASFTRFILPFAYQISPKRARDQHPALCWVEETELLDAKRRKAYFTAETAEVLFTRAKRFTLRRGKEPVARAFAPKPFRLKLAGGCSREVAFNAPQLLLFEASSRTSPAHSGCLYTGFLVLEIYFTKPGATLHDLLMLDERLRYKDEKYDGHLEEEIAPLFAGSGASCLYDDAHSCDKKSLFNYWRYLLQQPVALKGEISSLLPEIWVCPNKRHFCFIAFHTNVSTHCLSPDFSPPIAGPLIHPQFWASPDPPYRAVFRPRNRIRG